MDKEKQIEHLDFLRYFWEEKGDIERYACFEDIKPWLQENYPEILKAWSEYKASERTLSAVLKEALHSI